MERLFWKNVKGDDDSIDRSLIAFGISTRLTNFSERSVWKLGVGASSLFSVSFFEILGEVSTFTSHFWMAISELVSISV